MELIAGVDEVGRGPLAGPVMAAAVIFQPGLRIDGVKDSKQLTEKQRERLSIIIKEKALTYAIGRAEVEEIDTLNILQASLLAMKRAIEQLNMKPTLVLIDGNFCPKGLDYNMQAIVRGDESVHVISAASIIAKVERDHEMMLLDQRYPEYGFAQHKGYPTKAHLLALEKWGVCEIHRSSFRPVRMILERRD
jgi:ribonuclease HII